MTEGSKKEEPMVLGIAGEDAEPDDLLLYAYWIVDVAWKVLRHIQAGNTPT